MVMAADSIVIYENEEEGALSGGAEPASLMTLDAVESASLEWFALAVKPRFDKAVGRALDAKGYETFVPLYKKSHKYGSRSKDAHLPLFPGYVCCRFDMQKRLPILTTPGVMQILGAGSRPLPLSDVEIQSLQTALLTQCRIQPFPYLNAGQKVRITSGTLAGVEGIVLRTKPSLRLVLSITLLRRSVLLEIDRDQVSAEPLPNWAEVTC